MDIKKFPILENMGVLLQLKKEDKTFFAEYTPWTKLGYENLDSFSVNSSAYSSLHLIQEKMPTNIPKEIKFKVHKLIQDPAQIVLPTHKIKLHDNDPETSLKKLMPFFHKGINIRLDFNEKWTIDAVKKFWKSLGENKHSIEYIEDPTPFNLEEWKALSEFGIPLAIDHPFNRSGKLPSFVKHVIYRPYYSAIWEDKLKNKNVILTQNFTHPWSYYIAAIWTLSFPHLEMGLFPPENIAFEIEENIVTLPMDPFWEMLQSFKELSWQSF